MDIKIIFAVLASIASFTGYFIYIKSILYGKTQPHSYSWLIWSILQATAAVSVFSAGGGIWIVYVSMVGAINCGTVFLISLFYGSNNIKTFDKICLFGALLAVSLYVFLHNAFLSIIAVTVTDFIGYLPTLRKSYEEPKTENIHLYFLSFVSCILAIGALETFNFTTLFYLASLVVTNFSCILIILFSKNNSVTLN